MHLISWSILSRCMCHSCCVVISYHCRSPILSLKASWYSDVKNPQSLSNILPQLTLKKSKNRYKAVKNVNIGPKLNSPIASGGAGAPGTVI